MDPQANVEEQLRLARSLQEAFDNAEELDSDDLNRLTELVIAYAEWRVDGGFAADWSKALDQ